MGCSLSLTVSATWKLRDLIFVSVCISIRVHVYINSYIHELLIVLMLTEKASWF